MTASGLPLDTVYDLPLDVFYMYADAATRSNAARRMEYVADTSSAIAGALGGKAAKEHFEILKNQYEGTANG